jgi:pyruvate dehydrogenase (quinone)
MAFASRKPAVVEAVVDPYEPPMPPSVTPEQALKLAVALARGEPDGAKIIRTIFKDKVRELV